jgi:hypothetical protein
LENIIQDKERNNDQRAEAVEEYIISEAIKAGVVK